MLPFVARTLSLFDKMRSVLLSRRGQLTDSQELKVYTLLSYLQHSFVMLFDSSMILVDPLLTDRQ
jgi:hypothetical protein